MPAKVPEALSEGAVEEHDRWRLKMHFFASRQGAFVSAVAPASVVNTWRAARSFATDARESMLAPEGTDVLLAYQEARCKVGAFLDLRYGGGTGSSYW